MQSENIPSLTFWRVRNGHSLVLFGQVDDPSALEPAAELIPY